MVLDNFKRKNVQRKIEKDLRSLKKEEVYSDHKVVSILILVDDSIEKENLCVLAKELNVKEENINIIIFKETADKNSLQDNEVTSKDFGLFGGFKNKGMKTLLKSPVDLLINYVQENYYINRLVFESNACFKIGISSQNDLLYNLMINLESRDFQVFNSEIKKYLKILNKI